MSQHFKRCVAALAVLVILLVNLYVRVERKLDGSSKPPQTLKAQDREAISYDANTHKLTVQTATGSKTEYTRKPVIHIQKNGEVKVDRNLWGLEFEPFWGIGGGDGPRVHLGVAWFYFGRFDVNSHLAVSLNEDRAPVLIVPLESVSYNFWRNTSIFVGVDPMEILEQRRPVYQVGILTHF